MAKLQVIIIGGFRVVTGENAEERVASFRTHHGINGFEAAVGAPNLDNYLSRFRTEMNRFAGALRTQEFGSSWEMWDTPGAQDNPVAEDMLWPSLARNPIRATLSRPCCS